MRALFTTTGSAGHLGPLVPFADAIRRAGGEVLIATRGSSALRAQATGFDVWPFRDAPAEERDAVLASTRGLPLEEAHARLLREVFGGMDARAALPGVLETCATWRPDVVVYEPSERVRWRPRITACRPRGCRSRRSRSSSGCRSRWTRRASGCGQSRGSTPGTASPRRTSR